MPEDLRQGLHFEWDQLFTTISTALLMYEKQD